MYYAGFWIRFCAVLIDLVIYLSITRLIAFIPGQTIVSITKSAVTNVDSATTYIRMNAPWWYFFLFFWVFSACLEASPLQGSIGKRILKLKVVDQEGRRISIFRATWRLICKYISAVPFFLGFIVAAVVPKKRAWHDILAGTVVITPLPGVAFQERSKAMSVFKAYDIRGIYGKEWTAETAYLVGRCIPAQLDAKRVLVARDARVSSPEIRDALVRGLTEAGADVDDMGLSTTPMVYFFTARNHYDASVQVTASHNPAEYNGLKISKRDALPVGYDAGLKEIAERIQKDLIPKPAATPATVRHIDLLPEFVDWLRAQKPDLSGLRFAVDCSDGMAGLFARKLFGEQPIYLNDTPDGTFPHHDPNPLNPESCRQIIAAVKENGLDIGVIFDGDADRVMFIDEKGAFVQPDFLIPLIASHFIPNEKDPVVIHDIRTSRAAIEELHRLGARTVMGKVGHAYAKIALRTEKAVCGGELAGHYYFRDFYHCDSAEWAALIVLGAVAQAKREGKTFSDLLAPVRIYANSGEMNHRIENKAAVIEALRKAFIQREGEPAAVFDFDGIRLEWPKGWINVRASNTEPYLRLLMETHTPEELAEWKTLAQSVINKEAPDNA